MKKIVSVKELGEIITGNTPPRNDPDFYGDYKPFIKATDISESSKYTYKPEEYYSEKAYKKYIRSLIPKGSTCVVTIGSVGKKMTMAHCDLFINQAMNAIVPNQNFDSEYVYYVMKNNIHKLKKLDSGTASGRENVSKSAFSNMEIEIDDDITKQKKIGRILSAYDNLIENNQKQIKLLEEAAQRLYKQWFIDLRYPGHETTPIVDGLPKGWKHKHVDDFGIVVTGKTPSTSKGDNYGGNIPFVTIPDMHGNVFPLKTERYLTKKGADSQKVKYLPKNSVIVSCIATVGLVNIASEECQTNQQINSVILNDERDLYFFYESMLRIKSLLDGVGSNGATMTNVNKSKFGNVKVIYPTINLIEKYYDFCKPFFDKILSLSKSIIQLKEARDRLLPKLMNGELEI